MTIYTKTNPFLSQVKERYSLCKPTSNKNTFHVVLDVKGSDLTYEVGDSLGIFAVNDPQDIKNTLMALKATGEELVTEKSGTVTKLADFLAKKANLKDISRKFLGEAAKRQTKPEKKEQLDTLFLEGNKNLLNDYIEKHEIWDFLIENEETQFSYQEVCSLMMPMLPRLYSIASSQLVAKEEVHLTISMLQYHTNDHPRHGVCSNFLWNLVSLNDPVVFIYVQPHHGFTLPQDLAKDIIMVGPGTGVAPYRAFMQERIATKASGRNWLFFGERTRDGEFFYEDYWTKLESEGLLQLDLAFSRDQQEKIYVQHRLLEKGSEVYSWLESGAIFYVCGDAHHMAKDVDATLNHIIQTHGQKTEEEAKLYLKQLRHDKRYLRDVY